MQKQSTIWKTAGMSISPPAITHFKCEHCGAKNRIDLSRSKIKMAICGACKNKIQKTPAAENIDKIDVFFVFYITAGLCSLVYFFKGIDNGTGILMSFFVSIVLGPFLAFMFCTVGGLLLFLSGMVFDDAENLAIKNGISAPIAWLWGLICAILTFLLIGQSWIPIFFGQIPWLQPLTQYK